MGTNHRGDFIREITGGEAEGTVLNPSTGRHVSSTAKIGKALAEFAQVLRDNPGMRAMDYMRERCPEGGAYDPSTRGCVNSDTDGRKKALLGMAGRWDEARNRNNRGNARGVAVVAPARRRQAPPQAPPLEQPVNGMNVANGDDLTEMMRRLELERRELNERKAELNARNEALRQQRAEQNARNEALRQRNAESARIARDLKATSKALREQKQKLAKKEANVRKIQRMERKDRAMAQAEAEFIAGQAQLEAEQAREEARREVARLQANLDRLRGEQMARNEQAQRDFDAEVQRRVAEQERAIRYQTTQIMKHSKKKRKAVREDIDPIVPIPNANVMLLE